MTRRDFLWLIGLTGCYPKEIISPSGIENDSTTMKRQIIDWWSGSTTTSAFSDVWGWWRADTYSGSSPNITLTDRSGNGRDMVQQAGTLTPGTASGSGQAKMTGGATARLLSTGTLKRWPLTVFTIGRRTAGATCGFFGHTGASPFNSSWYGYESTNRLFVYHTNGTSNTTAEAGADACYVQRTGWGSRLSFCNGILQADQILSSMTRGAAAQVELGTSYRGLNFDFYECLVWDRTLTLTEIDEVHTYINTRYGMSIPLWSSYSAAPVIRLRGQSNASGRGDRGVSDANIPAEYDAAITGCSVWDGTVTALIGDSFATLNVNSDNHMLGENGTPTNAQNYFGPELTLCKEYLDRVGGSVYLHKYALGSTMLEYSGVNAFWDPTDETQGQNNTNRCFGNDMRNWWKSMVVHQTNSRKPNIIGDIWFQGEQDATIQANAEAYSANLQSFFTVSDAEQGVRTTSKKLICRIHINGSETYKSTVRAQQALAAAAITGATLIDTDSYGTRGGDGVHLSAQGQLDLGTYLASLL